MAQIKRTAQQLFLTVVYLIIGFLPTWIFLGARAALSPEGFWQNLAVSALGIAALGGFQLFLLVFLIMGLVSLWTHRGPIF